MQYSRYQKKDPFTQIDHLAKQMDSLGVTVNASRLPSKDRYTRPQIIDREGRFIIEEKVVTADTDFPSSAEEGEIMNVNGQLYIAINENDIRKVGMNTVELDSDDSTTYTVLKTDSFVTLTTSASNALTLTLPEAETSLGQTLTFSFVSDGGQNVTINRTGSDTIDDSGDTGNTSITMQDADDRDWETKENVSV